MTLDERLDLQLVWQPDAGHRVVTEGPQWDGAGFRFTRIEDSLIMRYSPSTGSAEVLWNGTNHANGTMFDSAGKYYVCEGGSHAVVRYDIEQRTLLADSFHGDRLNIPNDLAIDPHGRIWFTDPWYEGVGGPETGTRAPMRLNHESVYRLDPLPDGSYTITRVVFDTTRPNGILFSRDFGTLYVAQSGRKRSEESDLRAYPVREDGILGPKMVLYNFWPNRGVDGMKLDIDGNIWATAGNRNNTEQDAGGLPPGPKIIVFSPQGKVLRHYMLPEPVQKPTNCAFGGSDMKTLLVTTSDGHVYTAQTRSQGHVMYPQSRTG